MSAVLKFDAVRRQATERKSTWLDEVIKSEKKAREEIEKYARLLADRNERIAAVTEHARQLGEQAVTLREQAEERERELNRVVATNTELEQRFNRLVDKWRRETRRLSSVTQMALHPDYQKIIGMGWNAVPLILREMQERGGHWLWALHAITDEDPAPEGATFHEAVQAWLEWGREHHYLT